MKANGNKPWQFFVNQSDKLKRNFLELINEDKSDLGAYIDNRKLLNIFESKDFSYRELIHDPKSLYSVALLRQSIQKPPVMYNTLTLNHSESNHVAFYRRCCTRSRHSRLELG